MRVLSIDVGGTFIKSAVISEEEIVTLPKRPTPCTDLEQFLDVIADLYRENSDVDGIALSMPGVVDEATGFMYTGGSLTCIRDADLPALIRARCGQIPVTVANDAKAGALAELERGVLKDVQNALILVIGTAIGGAVICDRVVLTGSHRFAGEFSFMVLPTADEQKPTDNWGFMGGSARVSMFYGKLQGDSAAIKPEEVFRLAQVGDEKALAAIRMFCDEMAPAVSNLQCVTDPDVIAFGGGISEQPLFIELMQESIRIFQQKWGLCDIGMPEICVAACRYHDNTMGAYLHFLQQGRSA